MKRIVCIILTSLLLLYALSVTGVLIYQKKDEHVADLPNTPTTETSAFLDDEKNSQSLEDEKNASDSQGPVFKSTVEKLELPMTNEYEVLFFETYLFRFVSGTRTPNVNFEHIGGERGYKGPSYPSENDIILPAVTSLPDEYSYLKTEFKGSSFLGSQYTSGWQSIFSSVKGEMYSISLSQYMHANTVEVVYSEKIECYRVETEKFKGVLLEYEASTDYDGGVATSCQLVLDDGEFVFRLIGKDVSKEDMIELANSMDLHPPREYYLEPEL